MLTASGVIKKLSRSCGGKGENVNISRMSVEVFGVEVYLGEFRWDTVESAFGEQRKISPLCEGDDFNPLKSMLKLFGGSFNSSRIGTSETINSDRSRTYLVGEGVIGEEEGIISWDDDFC